MTSLKERCIHTIYQHQELMKKLNTLPVELQDLIFLTLTQMAALSDSHLSSWSLSQLSHFDFSLCKNITDSGIKIILQRFPQIESLKLGDSGISSQSLQIISQNCYQLKRLDITDLQVKENDFNSLKKCSSLTTLIVKKVSGLKPKILGKMLGHWPINLIYEDLTTLDVSVPQSTQTTPKWYTQIIKKKETNIDTTGLEYMEALMPAIEQNIKKTIKHLSCACYTRGGSSSKLDSSTASFQIILDQCPSLVSLDISGHSIDINALKSTNLRALDISYTTVNPSSDLFFSTLQSNFPRLESLRMVELVAMRGIHLPSLASNTSLRELDLGKCISLDSSNVVHWGKSASSPFIYSSLSLSGCKDIIDTSFGELAGVLSEYLTELNLSGVWKLDKSLSIVASRCPNLTSLDLSLCKIMSNQSIIDIARGCPLLRSLELYSCKNVTDEAIIELAEHCPELTLLNLYSVPATDKSIGCFGQKLKNLTSLDCSCTNISDESLCSIASGCPLTYFSCIGCTKVSDFGVSQLVRGCKNLQKLVLNECKLLTDLSLLAIAQQLKFLRELSMLGCEKITGEAILKLGQNCSGLRTLRLSSGTPITTSQIRSLYSIVPNISLKL